LNSFQGSSGKRRWLRRQHLAIGEYHVPETFGYNVQNINYFVLKYSKINIQNTNIQKYSKINMMNALFENIPTA